MAWLLCRLLLPCSCGKFSETGSSYWKLSQGSDFTPTVRVLISEAKLFSSFLNSGFQIVLISKASYKFLSLTFRVEHSIYFAQFKSISILCSIIFKRGKVMLSLLFRSTPWLLTYKTTKERICIWASNARSHKNKHKMLAGLNHSLYTFSNY